MDRTVFLMLVFLVMAGCVKKGPDRPDESVDTPVVRIVGIGKVLPVGGISKLASSGSGIVIGISATSGSKVKKGEVLVRLDNTGQLLEVEEAESKILSQEKSAASAGLLVDQKKIAANEKLRKLTDAQELVKNGSETGENVKTLQNDYDQLVVELKKLQNDLALQQSQLKELAVQKAIKARNLELTTLRAPMDGTVLDVVPKIGEAVSQYQVYAELAPDVPLIVKAEVDEMFAGKLEPGQKCTIRINGENQPVANGSIIRISADLKKKSLFSDSGEDMEDRRVREVEISLDSTNRVLLIDTKVECTIQIK